MTSRPTLLIATLALGLACLPDASAQQASDMLPPEGPGGGEAASLATAKRHMIVAAHPLAAEAGLAMLRAGGSAADALVAAQVVLGLVEPQSSGLGGGAFLLWFDAATGTLTSLDARETAPATATGALFLDADGAPLPFFDAVIGGRSVGVPGVPRLLETVHQRWGRLDWPDLFEPAIRHASGGFAVTPRLNALIAADRDRLAAQEGTRDYFLDAKGAPLSIGATLANPAYAQTLRALAADGADSLYSGPLAEAIVATVRSHPDNPGQLDLSDLAAYRVIEREPVCFTYRAHDICGMGPPSSGGVAVAQILGMASSFDLAELGPRSPESWRILGDATRLAFADRERYLADPDFVRIPQGLVDPGYLADRARQLDRPDAMTQEEVAAGEPPWDRTELRLDGQSDERPATTHLVIVDEAGNVASLTSSIEGAFGSRLMVGGFLLNNQLTDFSFRPEHHGNQVANRVEGAKRPRSSMSPTIVLRDGRPVHALGSPGGSNIIVYVATRLVALIEWDMDMSQAIALPHLVNRFGTYEIEAGSEAEALADDLSSLGYATASRDLNSGLHGITITPTGLHGGADPRREGVALGD